MVANIPVTIVSLCTPSQAETGQGSPACSVVQVGVPTVSGPSKGASWWSLGEDHSCRNPSPHRLRMGMATTVSPFSIGPLERGFCPHGSGAEPEDTLSVALVEWLQLLCVGCAFLPTSGSGSYHGQGPTRKAGALEVLPHRTQEADGERY